jgi:hypothetical protein
MSVSTGLKPIESGATGFQKVVYTNSSNLSDNKLLYTYAKKSLTTTPYGNLFKSFNFPITNAETQRFLAEYGPTALSFLNVDEIVVVEIPKGEYGELIDGKTFQLTLPVTLNSVETATTVYGTYFGFLGPNANTYIGGKNLNNQLSERNKNYFGFDPSNDNGNNTNVTFLYCNDVTDGRPKSKGDETTVLTATTFTLNNNQASPYILSTVAFDSNDEVKVVVTSPTNASLTDVVVAVDGFQINSLNNNNNTWVKINAPGISSVSPEVYQNGNVINQKEITVTISQRVSSDLEWDVWSPTNKFPTQEGDESKKIYAAYDGIKLNGQFIQSYDKPVGILYQDKGFAVITDPQLVQGFRYTAGTSSGFNTIPSGSPYNSGINFAKIYFTGTSESNSQFESITTEFVQNIICIANANEFISTTNSTYEGAYAENASEKPVFITSIGLYNAAGDLIGIGKLSEPVKKLPNTIVPFNIRLVI